MTDELFMKKFREEGSPRQNFRSMKKSSRVLIFSEIDPCSYAGSYQLGKARLRRQNPCSPQCFCNLSKSFFCFFVLGLLVEYNFFSFCEGPLPPPLMARLCKFVIVISYYTGFQLVVGN